MKFLLSLGIIVLVFAAVVGLIMFLIDYAKR